MNLILIAAEEVNDRHAVCLRDRRATHLIEVLRVQTGDEVRVGLIDGPMGHGRVERLAGPQEEHLVELTIRVSEPPPAEAAVDLILALPRPIMLKKILTQAASLGVKRIFLINANRVEKSFFSANLLRDREYDTYLLQGLEQARDTIRPEVTIHPRFRPFVEDHLPTLDSGYNLKLIAHPEAEPIAGLARRTGRTGSAAGRVLLAIGPEGGWVDFEVAKFREQGFRPVGMGARILRMDTAVVALLARLALLREMENP